MRSNGSARGPYMVVLMRVDGRDIYQVQIERAALAGVAPCMRAEAMFYAARTALEAFPMFNPRALELLDWRRRPLYGCDDLRA